MVYDAHTKFTKVTTVCLENYYPYGITYKRCSSVEYTNS